MARGRRASTPKNPARWAFVVGAVASTLALLALFLGPGDGAEGAADVGPCAAGSPTPPRDASHVSLPVRDGEVVSVSVPADAARAARYQVEGEGVTLGRLPRAGGAEAEGERKAVLSGCVAWQDARPTELDRLVAHGDGAVRVTTWPVG